MKEIKLTKGFITTVDDSDYEELSKKSWQALKNGKYGKWYAVSGCRPRVYMHQTILSVPKGFQVDHHDGDSLNNQRYNLKQASHSQNGANRKVKENKPCRYLGVHKTKYNTFQAFSRKNYIRHFAGTFKTENEAALAYNRLAVKLHGEFASLNIIT